MFLTFAKKASAFNSWFENAEEDLTDPVRCNSLEEIRALREAHEAFRSSLSSAQADFNQLAELDQQIKSYQVVSNPYTWFTMEALEETWRNLQKIIKVSASTHIFPLFSSQIQCVCTWNVQNEYPPSWLAAKRWYMVSACWRAGLVPRQQETSQVSFHLMYKRTPCPADADLWFTVLSFCFCHSGSRMSQISDTFGIFLIKVYLNAP